MWVAIFLSFQNIMQNFFVAQQAANKNAVSERYFYVMGVFLSLLSVMIAAALVTIFFHCLAGSFQILLRQQLSGVDGMMMCKLIITAVLVVVLSTYINLQRNRVL